MKFLSKRVRGGAAATLTVLLAATTLAAMAPSQALDPQRVGPRDSTRAGFPAYYTDDSGVALQLCIDGTAKCAGMTLRGDGAGGPGVGVSPDGEGFYYMATTSLSAPGLDLDIEFAAEAAWASRGVPATFDRLRIRGHSDTAGDIAVDTPYGIFTVTAEDPAAQRNVNFTEDIGCVGNPCRFRDMTNVPGVHITSWITANNPPAGYIGNGVTAQPANVAGAPATISAGGASTDRWVIIGKKARANRVSLPAALNFGNAARLKTKTVTMRNLGTNKTVGLNLKSVKLKGSKNFRKAKGTTCKGTTLLAVGDACKVVIRFRPVRASKATLIITDNRAVHRVKLRGR
jgi:hypothetical protein